MAQYDRYVNPVNKLKPPNKYWAEIVQCMDTHLNGVCPKHIYWERRPLESQNAYAFDYRVKNFKATTQQEFIRAIAGCVKILQTVSIAIKKDSRISDVLIDGIPILHYVTNELVFTRENDPNAILVTMPYVANMEEEYVSIDGWRMELIHSKDIISINESEAIFKYDGVKYNISKNGISYYEQRNNVETLVNIVSYDINVNPYVYISSLINNVEEYRIRYNYFAGAAAWGDKYYAQDSDFEIQATNNTYLREVRYEAKCREIGAEYIDGKHCDAITKEPCRACGGSGRMQHSSPLGVLTVPYKADDPDSKPLEDMIRFIEPPQGAITMSKTIVDDRYERMCTSLGLVLQNMTNQSGYSKIFDYKQKLDIIHLMLEDSKRIIKEVYTLLTSIYDKNGIYEKVIVTHVGELTDGSISDINTRMNNAKVNNMHPAIIEGYVDSILLKTLGDNETTRTIIKYAKKLDMLYIYGINDLAALRAQVGNITQLDIKKHNNIIRDLQEFYVLNDIDKDPSDYINTLYQQSITAPSLI